MPQPHSFPIPAAVLKMPSFIPHRPGDVLELIYTAQEMATLLCINECCVCGAPAVRPLDQIKHSTPLCPVARYYANVDAVLARKATDAHVLTMFKNCVGDLENTKVIMSERASLAVDRLIELYRNVISEAEVQQ